MGGKSARVFYSRHSTYLDKHANISSTLQVAMAAFVAFRHHVAKAQFLQPCMVLQTSPYLDLIRPMQITMDTSAQQLLRAKRTVHAIITTYRKPSTRRTCMVSSATKS